MNKTIIININGLVFHIEEEAYEILKNYMTDVKRHFLNSADSIEITTDIENRIAEMFNEILAKENKQVIIEQDVKLVIEQMGTVEDFEHAEQDATTTASNSYNNTEQRKLFRDPDDHLLGGVCSGIAKYFDIQAAWVRLAFALAFIFAGSGLILYIILWIVIPKAVTRADRMAMMGEKLNLQGFKNNFEEELSSVKGQLTNFRNEARPFIYKARDFFGDFFHHLGVFLGGAGKVLVKLLGILILLTCFGFAIALVVGLVAFVGFGAGHPDNFFPFTVVEYKYANRVYISAFLVAFIPVLSLILLVIKLVFNTSTVGKTTVAIMLVTWIFAIGFLAYYGIKAGASFRSTASFTATTLLKPTKNTTYYLQLNNIKYFTHEDSLRLNIKDHFNNMVVINDEDNDDEPRSVTIRIEKSDVPQPILVQKFSAKGHNDDDALFNARNTRYVFTQQDSILKFDYKLRRTPGESWHAEEIELTLKVPLNSKLVIDEDLDRYIEGVGINDCKEMSKTQNGASAAFIMTTTGLQCEEQFNMDNKRYIDSVSAANKHMDSIKYNR